MRLKLLLSVMIVVLIITATGSKEKISSKPMHGQNIIENGKKNIIAIQLESFQSFVLQREVDGQEVTPNLNKLIKKSLYYPNFFLQNGSGNTVDAEFMFNTSLHPLTPGNVISNSEASRRFTSLPHYLRTQGYETITMHTNNAMFYNRKEFYSALGFNRFLDKKFFGTKDFFAFGASDDVLYEKGLPVLEEYAEEWQPFYAQFISMTSHHPFTIPKKFRDLKLPKEYEKNIVGDYLQATHYADAELGRLFTAMKENGMWENTVLVLYGDHTGIQMRMVDEAGKAALKLFLGHDYSEADALRMPFLIHSTDLAARLDPVYGGHMDMLPTLMSVMNFTVPNPNWFGYDLTKGTPHVVAIRGAFADPGSFVDQGILFNPLKGTALDTSTGLKQAATPAEYQTKYNNVLQRFKESDAYIAKLPKKTEDFGETVTLTVETPFFTQVDDIANKMNKTDVMIPPSDITATDKRQEGWYKVSYNGIEGWIQPEHPILETWGLTETKKKTRLYEEPSDSSKYVMSVGVQKLNYSQEWVGMGWYKIVTWAGEYWGKLE
ncbi:MAG: LTA synthase family protein [Gorillibacterium sp.]|nr:LTA synthase family protein [Gorillibacterium sp.]